MMAMVVVKLLVTRMARNDGDRNALLERILYELLKACIDDVVGLYCY